MAPFLASRRAIRAAAVCAVAVVAINGAARAQQLIGYVKADDADVTGATEVLDGQAVLAGSVGVTAKSHTAVITLGRGGLARVCQTSALHMTQSKQSASTAATVGAGAAGAEPGTAPLLFSLDRGAVEIRMNGLASDAIMTPDLRMTVLTNGPLDVRLRVARNGDTCVENRGGAAPALAVSDPFGTSMYELMAGQHVLFEHGDMHEVVDHETEPCGCPDEPGATVAEALLAPGGQKPGKAPAAADQHPFPAAISEGLAPGASPQSEADPAQPQVTTALRYNAADDTGGGNGAAKAGAPAAPVVTMATVPSSSQPASLGVVQAAAEEAGSKPANKPANHSLVHAIGHFFRYLFGN